MSQTIILNNLIKYITIVEKEFNNELNDQLIRTKKHASIVIIMRQITKHQKEFIIYLNELKEKFDIGMCLGFAVCHGVMDELDHLEWWEESLRLTADWRDEPLHEKIVFSNKKTYTRYYIFARVLNYICATSVNFDKAPLSNFLLKDMTQEFFLKPFVCNSLKNKHAKKTILKSRMHKSVYVPYPLDFLDEKQNIQTVRNSVFIAGSFTLDQIEIILKPNLRKNILGIVFSKNPLHAVRIGKRNKKFILYHSNYDHRTPQNSSIIQPIYEKFDTLKKMLNELITIQSTTLTMALISFKTYEQFDLSYYNELISNLPGQLIKNGGLHNIAHYNPIVCKKIIKMTQFSQALEIILVTELLRPLKDGWNGFHFIARYAQGAMHQLIMQTIDKSCKNVYAILPELFVKKNNDNWTGFHMLARYCPRLLSKLIKEKSNIHNVLPQLLVEKNKDNWTGLHMIARYSPQFLSKLLLFLEEKNKIALQKQFFHALTLKNSEGQSGLNFIIIFKPAVIARLINLAKQDETLDKKFNEAVQHSQKINDKEIIKYIESRNKLLLTKKPEHKTQHGFFKSVNITNTFKGLTTLGNTFILSSTEELTPSDKISNSFVKLPHSR